MTDIRPRSAMDRVMAVLDGAEHQHSADQGYPPGTTEYALGTPDDPSRCVRCQRRPLGEHGELCGPCRSFLLGDTDTDPDQSPVQAMADGSLHWRRNPYPPGQGAPTLFAPIPDAVGTAIAAILQDQMERLQAEATSVVRPPLMRPQPLMDVRWFLPLDPAVPDLPGPLCNYYVDRGGTLHATVVDELAEWAPSAAAAWDRLRAAADDARPVIERLSADERRRRDRERSRAAVQDFRRAQRRGRR